MKNLNLIALLLIGFFQLACGTETVVHPEFSDHRSMLSMEVTIEDAVQEVRVEYPNTFTAEDAARLTEEYVADRQLIAEGGMLRLSLFGRLPQPTWEVNIDEALERFCALGQSASGGPLCAGIGVDVVRPAPAAGHDADADHVDVELDEIEPIERPDA
ncbi:MAG: hypothetical protein ACON3Z_10715 [Bradymonadia bacterium]